MQKSSENLLLKMTGTNNLNPKLIRLLGLSLFTSSLFADELQSKLMDIAAKEAQIANIGSNKFMMLYGKSNPLPIINRWNELENHPPLTEEQINQINNLEQTKQKILLEHSSIENN